MQQAIDIANQLALAWQHIPPSFWEALIAAGILTPFLNIYKHFRFTKRQREVTSAAMHIAVVVAAGALSVLQYLLSAYPQNPTVIAMHTAVLGFMTQPVYFLVVRPLWKYFSSMSSEAKLFENEMKAAAAVPAEGVPLSTQAPVATPSISKSAFEQSLEVRDFTN